ncbi:hypothetical protein AL755_19760 [Arthrobacter sp. ERGS1:01]|uniref:hypothetical protein n=1 Tax=Arthrobacter sp. ERGS1:01 TaxID=1704044 RepID=UPI0006B5D772|nr:hypothetical protein [Arthrobacter sp. ERGS1:01]ALE07191.1 hypothetical protein AL755_19760 [Arthrobacter sp. ERGS1:01]
MDGLGDILFGPIGSAAQATYLLLRILGGLILCFGLVFIARRSDLGWLLAAASFALTILSGLFNLPFIFLPSGTYLALYMVGSWIPPLLGLAACIYGLAWFRRAPASDALVRDISRRPFHGADLVAPLAVAVVYAAATMLPVLIVGAAMPGLSATPGAYGSSLSVSFPLGQVFLGGLMEGLLVAALVGLAQRSRWAWLLMVPAAIAALIGTALTAQGSVLIFLYLAQGALALYGWSRWGALRADPQRSGS